MSITKITYLSQFTPIGFFIFSNPNFHWLYFSDIIEIKLFLENCLDQGKCYVASLELIISEFDDDENETPIILLCDPILFTRNSSPTLISKFIRERISIASDRYNLDYDFLMEMRKDKGTPYIRLKYHEINLF